MRILLLHQFFMVDGNNRETRFFDLGSRLASMGHQVTVISGNSGLALALGNKRIGLLQTGGMAIVSLNIDYSVKMNRLKKGKALMSYARQASMQGRRLPRPDLIYAVSPPLTTALPALSLSSYYRVPLVLDLGEAWPEAIIRRGALRNRPLISLARRLEMKAYRQARHIFVPDKALADLVSDICASWKKVEVLPGKVDLDSLARQYEHVFREAVQA